MFSVTSKTKKRTGEEFVKCWALFISDYVLNMTQFRSVSFQFAIFCCNWWTFRKAFAILGIWELEFSSCPLLWEPVWWLFCKTGFFNQLLSNPLGLVLELQRVCKILISHLYIVESRQLCVCSKFCSLYKLCSFNM